MLVYLVSFYPTKWLRNFAVAPNFHPTKLTMFLFGCPVLSIPHNDTLVYLVPPARSRYCASPEASIPLNPLNPLNSASTLGATASAPTQHFLPHKMAAQFCGGPDLCFAGVSRASGTFSLLRLS